MSKLETFLKELYEKQTEITTYELRLPDGRTEKKRMLYVEVTDDIWENILMKDKYFKKAARRGHANIGGFEVIRGSDFVVHFETYIKEKPQYKK